MIVQITNFLTNALITNTFLCLCMAGNHYLKLHDLYVHMCPLPLGGLLLETEAFNPVLKLTAVN
jgi:hypothetical protein